MSDPEVAVALTPECHIANLHSAKSRSKRMRWNTSTPKNAWSIGLILFISGSFQKHDSSEHRTRDRRHEEECNVALWDDAMQFPNATTAFARAESRTMYEHHSCDFDSSIGAECNHHAKQKIKFVSILRFETVCHGSSLRQLCSGVTRQGVDCAVAMNPRLQSKRLFPALSKPSRTV